MGESRVCKPFICLNFNHTNNSNSIARKTQQQVDQEMYNVGGSIVRIREENGTWSIVKNDPHNRRITQHKPPSK